jgi:hypothetical protein
MDLWCATRGSAWRVPTFHGQWVIVIGMMAQAASAGTVRCSYSATAVPLEQELQASRLVISGITLHRPASPCLGSIAERLSEDASKSDQVNL